MKEYIKGSISVLLIMIPTIVFGLLEMPTQMAISLFAGFASTVILNIDKFESFTAWKLKAKVREATEIIDQANATVDQLKAVAEPLLNTNLVSLAYDGYFDGMDVDDKLKVFQKLYEVENKLDLNSGLTKELLKKTKKAIAYELFTDIGRAINRDGLSTETVFFSKYSIETEQAFATVEQIENYFSRNPELRNEKVNKAFGEFKKFVNNYY